MGIPSAVNKDDRPRSDSWCAAAWVRRTAKFLVDSFLGKLLRPALKLIPQDQVLRIWGGPCRGMRWIVGSSTHGCWLGTYEVETQDFLSKHIRTGMVVYDAGANVGYFTLMAARLVGPRGHVFAFEPLLENIRYLQRHIDINQLTNVTVIPAALSAQNGSARFRIGADRSMGSLGGMPNDREVSTLSLDSFVAAGHPPPDFIKMDIEGGEADALRGAPRILSSNKTIWLISVHGEETYRRCWDLLGDAQLVPLLLDGRPAYRDVSPCEIYALPRPI